MKEKNTDDEPPPEKSTVSSETSIESSIVKPTESPTEHKSDTGGKVESERTINNDLKKSDEKLIEKDKLMDLQKMIAKEFDLELEDVKSVENNDADSNTETTEIKNDKEVEKSSSVVNESKAFCFLLFIYI